MPEISVGLILVVLLILCAEFVNGWTDAPNAMYLLIRHFFCLLTPVCPEALEGYSVFLFFPTLDTLAHFSRRS
jgi:hypothetical protein